MSVLSRSKAPTAVMLLNLGGPRTLAEVNPFLTRLFSDQEMVKIPFGETLGKYIAARRTPKIAKQYEAIGGGSPIQKWTELQASRMITNLDKLNPDTAPHKYYIAFRYANPLTEDALNEMVKDGVRRAVIFTQYPQYSCYTTGNSLKEIWRQVNQMNLKDKMEFSVIDRWPTHPTYIKSFVERVKAALQTFPEQERNTVPLLFTAHSLPQVAVDIGDPYPHEVAATVDRVMAGLDFSNPYRIVWQSKVGLQKWLQPSTQSTLEALAKSGQKNGILVPIAFTSDHIETLYELDHEYIAEAHRAGMTGLRRAESLNDSPLFIQAMTEIVSDHLRTNEQCSSNLYMKCPLCVNPRCDEITKFTHRSLV
eukprot:GILK01002695.1.p1 GENE.GILK01002695.1~~GILK01002695.1.p1  ORF type:complete len:376 (+),score=50.86 GILK01002695.1:34-1128(+)